MCVLPAGMLRDAAACTESTCWLALNFGEPLDLRADSMNDEMPCKSRDSYSLMPGNKRDPKVRPSGHGDTHHDTNAVAWCSWRSSSSWCLMDSSSCGPQVANTDGLDVLRIRIECYPTM